MCFIGAHCECPERCQLIKHCPRHYGPRRWLLWPVCTFCIFCIFCIFNKVIGHSVSYWHAWIRIGPGSDKDLQTSKCLGQSSWPSQVGLWYVIMDNWKLAWYDVGMMCADRKASGRWVRIPLSSSTHRMASISASCGSFFPLIPFYYLPKKIFCSHCVLTVFQSFKLCYQLLWHDMAWLIWKYLTYPLNSNFYCSLHTVTESLD